MKLSLISAKSENGVIGNGPDIPWSAKGEQLIFKALTYNQWLLVGRKTFESMGILPHRKYAVVSRSGLTSIPEGVLVFSTIEDALAKLEQLTTHVFVSGWRPNLRITDRQSRHDTYFHCAYGCGRRCKFPTMPDYFKLIFEQYYKSNIDYTYQIWKR